MNAPLSTLVAQINAVFHGEDRRAALVGIADQLEALDRDNPKAVMPWLLMLAAVVGDDDRDPALIAAVLEGASTALAADAAVTE